MRLLYAFSALFIWAVMSGSSPVVMEASANVKFLALAIMIGGAMAGGDGK